MPAPPPESEPAIVRQRGTMPPRGYHDASEGPAESPPTSEAPEGPAEALLVVEHRLEEFAAASNPIDRDGHRKVVGVHALVEFVPFERHRDRAAWMWPN